MYPPTRTPRRRTARTLLVVVLVGLALVAGVVLWQAESPGTVQPGASPTDRSSPQDPAGTGYLAPAVPAADPVASAVAWLQATRSLSFADGAPSSWTARARPVVTDRLAAGYARLRDGGAGADWTDFVAAGCVSVVTDADGVIPLEAPRTEDAVNVQVAGRLVTTCTQGGAAGRPPQDLAATVTLRRGPGGVWLVDQQLF